jgi:enoyl-CoA hydratase/carnithine racemase
MGRLATYEREGRIASIRMDDGKVNAFSIAMLRAIHEALEEAERDGAVVVLSGREGIFSAGFDLNVFARGQDEILKMLLLGATLAERILSFPTPWSAHALVTRCRRAPSCCYQRTAGSVSRGRSRSVSTRCGSA